LVSKKHTDVPLFFPLKNILHQEEEKSSFSNGMSEVLKIYKTVSENMFAVNAFIAMAVVLLLLFRNFQTKLLPFRNTLSFCK
jgi:hypothetical protein